MSTTLKPSNTPLTVLVVEGDGIVALDLQRSLESLGFRVCGTADNALTALAQAEAYRPDMVLLDLNLRGAPDGIAVAQAMRNLHDIPVVFLTTDSDPELLARTRTAEPYGYLVKPMRMLELQSTIEIAHRLHAKNRRLRAQSEELRSLSMRDELTGLYNRRAFQEFGMMELRLAQRADQVIVVLYVDVDAFKRINDRHGHVVGDQALRDTAAVLRGTFRETDIIARVGGDEFAVLSIGGTLNSAEMMMQRLEVSLEQHRKLVERPFELRMSVGAHALHAKQCRDFEELIAGADKAMYSQKRRRKRNGKAATNQAEPAADPPPRRS
jgi:two-component system cell cycle response regulator